MERPRGTADEVGEEGIVSKVMRRRRRGTEEKEERHTREL